RGDLTRDPSNALASFMHDFIHRNIIGNRVTTGFFGVYNRTRGNKRKKSRRNSVKSTFVGDRECNIMRGSNSRYADGRIKTREGEEGAGGQAVLSFAISTLNSVIKKSFWKGR